MEAGWWRAREWRVAVGFWEGHERQGRAMEGAGREGGRESGRAGRAELAEVSPTRPRGQGTEWRVPTTARGVRSAR